MNNGSIRRIGEKGAENYSEETITENNANLFKKHNNLHIQETQRTPSKINAKRATIIYITLKILKAKTKT